MILALGGMGEVYRVEGTSLKRERAIKLRPKFRSGILSITLILFSTAVGLAQFGVSAKWVFPTGGSVFSSPAIGADGTLYVGSSDGNLYAINSDGTQKWAFLTGGSVSSSPAIGADALMSASHVLIYR